jgi:uncharacterized protein YcaQ
VGVPVADRLPAALARRIALAAQGFADPRPEGGDYRRVRRAVERLAVVQIDSVNVLSRSHYLPAFSRLGSYPRPAMDALAARRAVFEYWAHEASLLPLRLHPHLRWRMAAAEEHAWGSMVRIQRERPGYVAEILDRVRADGPLKASDLLEPRPDRPGTMWNWHAGKVALEWLFYTGVLTTRERTAGFERVYDLTERVIPAEVLAQPTPEPADAFRELVRTAARALGVATERDLRDYFRLKPTSGSSRRRRGRRSPSWPRPGSCSRSRSTAGARRPGWTPRRAGHGGSGPARC